MLGLGLAITNFGSKGGVSDVADGGYSAEAIALFARMTSQPSATRKRDINDFIASLKTASVWTKLEVLQIYAAHDTQAAKLNWCSTSYEATLTNSPTFTADYGYGTNGTTSYIDTGFNPSLSAFSSLNDASMGMWVNKARQEPIAYTTISPNQSLLYRNADTSFFASLNVATAGADSLTSLLEVIHLMAVSRTGAAATKAYQSNKTSANFTRASTAISNRSVFLGARSTVPVDIYKAADYAAFFHGKGLTDADITALQSAFVTYMRAVGNYKYGIACWGDSRTLGATQTPFTTTVRTNSTNKRVAYNGGVSGETSTQIKTRMLADTAYQDFVQVIWAGYNNHNSVATVEADIAAMVAEATTNNGGRYLVLTIPAPRDSGFYPGTTDGDNIAAINAWIMSTYGTKAVDVATTVYAGDPNDVIALAYVIDPVTDYNHMNTAGLTLVATDVEAACVSNGW